MAMLAEPRRRTKWTLNPRGKLWSNDDNKFGQKLLEKMGWSKGKGLGRHEQGDVDPIKLHYKNDSKGIGFKGHDDDWIAHKEDFNAILMQLNGMETPPEEQQIPVKSLEIRSKTSRARVHYHKFTRGKDLSRYSAEDLACILGKRKKTEDNETQEDEEDVSGTDVEHTHGITTIRKGNIHEYFASKLAALRDKSLVSQDNDDESEGSKTERKVRFNDELNMVKEFSSQTIIAPKNEEEVTGIRIDSASKDEVIKMKKKRRKATEREESIKEGEEIVDKKKKKKKYQDAKEENINNITERSESELSTNGNMVEEMRESKKKKKKNGNVVSKVVEEGRQGMDMYGSGQEEVRSKEKKDDTLNENVEETRERTEKKEEKMNFMKRKKKGKLKQDETVVNENLEKDDLQDFNAESEKNKETLETKKKKRHIFSVEEIITAEGIASSKSFQSNEENGKKKKSKKCSPNEGIEDDRHSEDCEMEDSKACRKKKSKRKNDESNSIPIEDINEEKSKQQRTKRKKTNEEFIQEAESDQVLPLNYEIEDINVKCTEDNNIVRDQTRMVESRNDTEILTETSASSKKKKKKRKMVEEEVESSAEFKQKRKKKKRAEIEIKEDISSNGGNSPKAKNESSFLNFSSENNIQKDVGEETSTSKDETTEGSDVHNSKKMYNGDPSFSYLHNAIRLDKLQNVRKQYKKAEFHKFIGTNLYEINGYGNN